jgi:ABC-type uncharacterized transport system permease subunit
MANAKKHIEKRTGNPAADRLTAMVLCAFLGVFGAHKFYLGQKKLGIAFLVIDLTIAGMLVTALWSFVDLILMTADKRNSRNEYIVGIVLLLFAGGARGYAGRKVVDRTVVVHDEAADARCAPEKPAPAKEKK